MFFEEVLQRALLSSYKEENRKECATGQKIRFSYLQGNNSQIGSGLRTLG